MHEALRAELRRVPREVGDGDPGQEEGAGDPQPRGRVLRLPWHIQSPEAQEGSEIQDGAGRLITHIRKIESEIQRRFIITVKTKT